MAFSRSDSWLQRSLSPWTSSSSSYILRTGFLLGDNLDGLIPIEAVALAGDPYDLPLAGELDFNGEALLMAGLIGDEALTGLDSLMGGLGDG